MRWFWLTLAVIIAIGSSFGLYKFTAYINANLNTVLYRTYEGRIYFQDKVQYQQFKEAIANSPDVHIYKLTELLSSDDPLVDFEITTTQRVFPIWNAYKYYLRNKPCRTCHGRYASFFLTCIL